MSKDIQAIIFDIGGVLIRTKDQSGRRSWEQRLGLSPGELEAIVLNGDTGHRAQRGEMSDSALWQWVGDFFDLGSDLHLLRRDFWRGDVVDTELVDLIQSLRQNYRTAALSNATDALLDNLTAYGIKDLFDIVVGSAYEGVMKPDFTIYKRVLERLNLRPSQTVFIDDSRPNIDAARILGLETIHFTPELDLALALRDRGVRV